MNTDLLTARGRAAWLRSVDPGLVRVRCGVSLARVAEACGVARRTVWWWEQGKGVPEGAPGARYARIIRGLANHAEIPEGDS